MLIVDYCLRTLSLMIPSAVQSSGVLLLNLVGLKDKTNVHNRQQNISFQFSIISKLIGVRINTPR